jgi:cytochrome c peroxidase
MRFSIVCQAIPWGVGSISIPMNAHRFFTRVVLSTYVVLLAWAWHPLYGQSVGFPELPSVMDDYYGYAVENLPAHFGDSGQFLSAVSFDNTPADNQITNPGATLGRVLFYDKRLSHNNSTSCASCHPQANGFADSERFSTGADGAQSSRHATGLTNAKFYENGRFFWDERAPTLEAQVLMPIVDPNEMGMDLDELNTKLSSTSFYADLFQSAFGSPEIDSERISQAVSQFIRSLVSYGSKFDAGFDDNGKPDFDAVFTDQEELGRRIFHGQGRCSFCHTSNAQVATQVHNTGLDAFVTDPGAGDGKFKAPSLRNVEVREFFMHDGRFSSLEEVVEFYSTGIQDHPNLDFRLRDGDNDGAAVRLNFSQEELDSLVSFLRTLTDWDFLTDPKFSDPFVLPCDFNDDETCGINDLNLLLAEGPVVNGVDVNVDNGLFDLDGDGVIDNTDVAVWLQQAAESNGLASPYAAGDANLDGVVDGSDFNLWFAGKFGATTDWDGGDFNGDGVVDVSDFNHWNASSVTLSLPRFPTEHLPEPAALWLFLAGGLAVICKSRQTRPK